MPNKVKVGFFSFTEILGGRHRAYNEWHLLDHMPENFKLEGLAWGQRWVAPPDLMAQRRVTDEGLARTHYVTLYLMTEPVGRTLDEFQELGATLRSLGRFFPDRESHLSGPFKLVKAYAAPRVLVDPEVVPYRPNRGVFVTVQDRPDGASEADVDELRQWYDQVHIPDLLGVRGVAGCWWFEALPGARGSAHQAPNPRGRTIRVYWLDDDPDAMLADMAGQGARWREEGRMIDLSKAAETRFVGAYRNVPWDSAFDWFDGA